MKVLSANLKADIEARKQPVEVKHHHYVPWAICIAAGLFLLLALVCTRWYMTAENLQQYKAADTKYRYLKLQTNEFLQQSLNNADSLYKKDAGGMRNEVEQKEVAIRLSFELDRQAQDKEEDAKLLREKAAKTKRNLENR